MEDNSFKCNNCDSTFCSQGNLNRHKRNFHPGCDTLPTAVTYNHIICILCTEAIGFKSYATYNIHLEEDHQISILQTTLSFLSKHDFELWRSKERRNVNYVCQSMSKSLNTLKQYYNCNRTDSTGKSRKNVKKGGSIKINGACPSRMIVDLYDNGQVLVKYYETHVGHTEEIRAHRLTTSEQHYLVDQLKHGINKDKIITNARNYNLDDSGLPGRLNSIKKKDLSNLSRRYNISRNETTTKDLAATAINVNEGNEQDKNDASLCMEGEERLYQSSSCEQIHTVEMNENQGPGIGARKGKQQNKEGTEDLEMQTDRQRTDADEQREVAKTNCLNFINEMVHLNDASFDVFFGHMTAFMTKMYKNLNKTRTKRKLSTQTYSPKTKQTCR